MAKPRRRARVLTLAVSMPAYTEYFVNAYGQEFRAALTRAHLAEPKGRLASVFRVPPEGTRPIVPLSQYHWRVYIGGALVTVVPQKVYEVTTPAPPAGHLRAVITFEDSRGAKAAAEIDAAYMRRMAWLAQGDDGHWFLRMRWSEVLKSKTKMSPTRRRVEQKPKKPRWPHGAPPEWPRKTDGSPMATYGAILRLGRAKTQELLKYRGYGE